MSDTIKLQNVFQLDMEHIRPSRKSLRQVNKMDEQYLGLVASIKEKGFCEAISVKKKTDTDGTVYWEIVNGLHRFNAALDCGLKKINVTEFLGDERSALEAQIMMNVHRVITKPIEYTQQLKRLLEMDKMMTETDLANRLGKSVNWIRERLNLIRIKDERIQSLIDNGTIKLVNAYSLARLNPKDQLDFVERAQTMDAREFVGICNERAKEVRDSIRRGVTTLESEFKPLALTRSTKDLVNEMETGKARTKLCNDLRTPKDGFLAAIKWALRLDAESVAIQIAKNEQRKATKEEMKRKRRAEVAKRREQATAKAAELAASTALEALEYP